MPAIPEPAPKGASWPEGTRTRDAFVLSRRPPHPAHDPLKPQGVLVEDERDAAGVVAPAATIFLTGRECAWRCAMCDLWQHTVPSDTPRGALPRQIAAALASLPADALPGETLRTVKLYNASSFFDPRAVPPEDYEPIAALLTRFSRVVVESHPALVGDRVGDFQSALARHRAPGAKAARLEVAMGLETANEAALLRLHKGMTLDLFARAAADLGRRGASLRVFLLVPPPFVAREDEDAALRRSVAFAQEMGAEVISLIPTRTGNGTLEALEVQGLFRRPVLADLERALEQSLAPGPARVFADLWDLERFSACPHCLPARRSRLLSMNHRQAVEPEVACGQCRESPPS